MTAPIDWNDDNQDPPTEFGRGASPLPAPGTAWCVTEDAPARRFCGFLRHDIVMITGKEDQ